jgi:hypothetical protein
MSSITALHGSSVALSYCTYRYVCPAPHLSCLCFPASAPNASPPSPHIRLIPPLARPLCSMVKGRKLTMRALLISNCVAWVIALIMTASFALPFLGPYKGEPLTCILQPHSTCRTSSFPYHSHSHLLCVRGYRAVLLRHGPGPYRIVRGSLCRLLLPLLLVRNRPEYLRRCNAHLRPEPKTLFKYIAGYRKVARDIHIRSLNGTAPCD